MKTYQQQLAILQEELAENLGIKGRLYFLERIRQLAQERMNNLQDEIDAMETELAEMRQIWEVADEY